MGQKSERAAEELRTEPGQARSEARDLEAVQAELAAVLRWAERVEAEPALARGARGYPVVRRPGLSPEGQGDVGLCDGAQVNPQAHAWRANLPTRRLSAAASPARWLGTQQEYLV